MRRLLDSLPMLLVMAATLAIVVYVGLGEAHRVNPRLQLEKLAVQGEVIRDPIDTFLQAGQPLEQFVGFETRARDLLASDPEIVAITLVDGRGEPIRQVGWDAGEEAAAASFTPAPVVLSKPQIAVAESEALYQVSLPLRNRFQQVGELRLSTHKAALNERVDRPFRAVGAVAVGCFVGFAALQMLLGRRRWVTEASFFGLFLLLSATVMATMFDIYAGGVQDRTKALANALGERLSGVVRLDLDLDDFTGIGEAFREYQRLNPEIRAIALIDAGTAEIHTDPAKAGGAYSADTDTYEFSHPLRRDSPTPQLRVAVSIPVSVVLSEIWSSGKNFLVLFFATGIVAFLFLDVGSAVQAQQRQGPAPAAPGPEAVGARLTLIRPAYFLVVFLDMLCISFLPQYAASAALADGLPEGWASWPFTIYFVAFALALVPAGRYAGRGDLKLVIGWGAGLAAAGMLLLAMLPGFWPLLAGRAVSGVGQGLLLIGIQTYLLSVVPAERRTQGIAVQVIGYNGALISGSAIGALLAVFIGMQEVFMVGAAIGGLCLLYLWWLVPATRVGPSAGLAEAGPPAREAGLLAGLLRVLGDWRFSRALLLIGIFSKLVLSGVIMFAIPLTLARRAFAQEDIGQLLMLYAAATLVAAYFAARLVDRLGSARQMLATGSVSAGVGMILVGLVGAEDGIGPALSGLFGAGAGAALAATVTSFNAALAASPIPFLPTLVVVLGMLLIGISHGLIAAPIITLVGDTAVAARLGRARVTASYRFLERVGHVAGPLLVGAVLLATDHNPIAISLFGLVSIACALLFLPGRTAVVVGAPSR